MNINKKLDLIRQFHEYIGNILKRGYINPISSINQLIDIINENFPHISNNQDINTLLEVSEEDEEDELHQENAEVESADEDENEEEVESTEEKEESADEESAEDIDAVSISSNESISFNLTSIINTSSEKPSDILNNDVSKILLYQKDSSHINHLYSYLKNIMNY